MLVTHDATATLRKNKADKQVARSLSVSEEPRKLAVEATAKEANAAEIQGGGSAAMPEWCQVRCSKRADRSV
jgi:hypothetical protein